MKKRTIVLILLVLVSVITFLDRLAIAVAGPRMQDELGISPERWGWVLGAFVLTYGLFEVPTGALGDRSGQRKVLTRIVVWWSVFTCLTGSVSGFVPLLVTRFLFGVGEAGAYPNIAGSHRSLVPPGRTGQDPGFHLGGEPRGGALAPLIVLPIQDAFGWRASFWILGAIGLAWAAGLVLVVPRRTRRRSRGSPRRNCARSATGSGGHRGPAIPWGLLLRSRQLWLIVGMYSCYAWGSWFYFSWLHTYLVKGRGFSEKEMGFFSSLPFILGAVANVGGGFLGDCSRAPPRPADRTPARGIGQPDGVGPAPDRDRPHHRAGRWPSCS